MRKEALYEALRERILTLEAAPGSSIDEVSLAESFGVSRTPLREVLQQLAGKGYVTLEKNRGASVSSMDLQTMRSFFQTAPLIYSWTAQLAAENATAGQIQLLRDTQAQFQEAVDRAHVMDMVVHNHGFHELIGLMANNAYLLPSLQRLLIDHSRMGHAFYRTNLGGEEDRVKQACEQHEALIEAIASGQSEEAAALALAHWDLSRDRLEQYVQPQWEPLKVKLS